MAVSAAIAGAQAPRGSDTLSAKSIADSIAVSHEIEATLRKDPNNAALAYRLGMVQWTLGERGRGPDHPDALDPPRWLREADKSLRLAVALAPANIQYRITLGGFLLASNVAVTRSAAAAQFKSALDLARRDTNAYFRAAAALEYGRTFWRRYDALANRRIQIRDGDMGRSISDAMQPVAKAAAAQAEVAEQDAADQARLDAARSQGSAGAAGVTGSSSGSANGRGRSDGSSAPATVSRPGGIPPSEPYGMLPMSSLAGVRELIESSTQALPASLMGATEFARADSLFREAYAADPAFPSAFRSVAMTLAEKANWAALDTFALNELSRAPWNSGAWFALGLARHRVQRFAAAAAAFDSAMIWLTPEERQRLDAIARILPPSKRGDRNAQSSTTQVAPMYWVLADAMWSDGVNQTRLEFLSRVVYAELRWTVEEFGLSGADTDRGDIYVRYGPPDVAVVIGPKVASAGESDPATAGLATYWLYRSGMIFAFTSMKGFGTAHIPASDEAIVDALRQSQPVRWDNLGLVQPDSIPVRLARFRASADSVDVFIAAVAPVDAIRRSAPGAIVSANLWLIGQVTRTFMTDTRILDSVLVETWTRRLPRAVLMYRVEVSAPGGQRTARAVAEFSTGEPFGPFGADVSDVLLTHGGGAPISASASWRDLAPDPVAGPVARGTQLGFVWENYDFGSVDGQSRYSVRLTITGQNKSVGAFAARVLGALATLAKVDHAPDHTTYAIDRAVPFAATVADRLVLSLGDTPPGVYSATLAVTDTVSGTTELRTVMFTVGG